MAANDKQVGGDHYKRGGEEHWDRMWRLYGAGYFVGCITKYVERYKFKNGLQDLEKAQHFLEKLIELETTVQKEFVVGEKSPEILWSDKYAAKPPYAKDGPNYEQGCMVNITVKEGADPGSARQAAAEVRKNIDVTRVSSTAKVAEGYNRTPPSGWHWYLPGEVMPTGWAQFVFEGAQAEGFLFTCRSCNAHFNAPAFVNPHLHHPCHDIADGSAPTPAYVDQD